MIDTRDLLIEIGTEELPPKALEGLSLAFASEFGSKLQASALTFGKIQTYATPRRLALLIDDLQVSQPNQHIDRKGPALSAAYDEQGNPTRAVEGFARSCSVSVSELEQRETDKGIWLYYQQVQEGKTASELIPGLLEQALAALPIPKRMRWGDGDTQFVRPVRWVLLLFGNEVIDAEILGIPAGKTTRGHRFHCDRKIEVMIPSEYALLLESEGKVIADFGRRQEIIIGQLQQLAQANHAQILLDQDNLDQVTALVEWPVALQGSFDKKFLEVPSEALITTMQDNQKYFPLVDTEGNLLPEFLLISNIESSQPDKVRLGNERVIRPRFSDAAFFWEQDKKTLLAEYIPALKDVMFQQKLGSLWDKTQRLVILAEGIARQLSLSPNEVRRAAELSRCDLMTEMVKEFPKLQGVMGRYYASLNGEPQTIALALDEQYCPRFAGERLPQNDVGQILAIADRLDTLTGIFAIGQKPTGVKDPFGLRRAALGVLRIIIECQLDLDIEELIGLSASTFVPDIRANEGVTEVFDYVQERMKAYYADRNISPDVVDAVMSQRPTRPLDFDFRVRAVREFKSLPEAEGLTAANKRIRNILKQYDGDIPNAVNEVLLTEREELTLFAEVTRLEQEVRPLFDNSDYTSAMHRLASLRETVDRFFDNVMVMSEDEAVRVNRLALLNRLSSLFLRTADLSRLQA